jgi:hypothetical protein
MTIEECISAIGQRHFPRPPATEVAIQSFVRTNGVDLPEDLTRFYLSYNGARLFSVSDAPFKFVAIESVVRVRMAILGDDRERYGPNDLYAVCALGDTDFAGINLNRSSAEFGVVRDCNHHGFPDLEYCPVIARSFAEFLSAALMSAGKQYWL